MRTSTIILLVIAMLGLYAPFTAAVGQEGPGQAARASEVGVSPWGPEDEIGRLNLMTAESRADVLSRLSGGTAYDLSVDYYIGMPSWQAAGDPHYRMWMTHTPGGTVVDDPLGVGEKMNEHVSYTGAAISMYTHTGTHIDALNHFGLDGKIWNGFRAKEHLGDRGWQVGSASSIPPHHRPRNLDRRGCRQGDGDASQRLSSDARRPGRSAGLGGRPASGG